MPVATPTPGVAPTPTPTPVEIVVPEEQIFRVAGVAPSPEDYGLPVASTCSGMVSVMAGLVRVSPEFRIEPDWAETWEPRNGGSRWLFYIRPNDAGWSSGQGVTAHDFVRAWRRLVDPSAGSASAAILFDVQNAREIAAGELPTDELGVTALNELTLEVTLERVRNSFPRVASSPLLSPFAGPFMDVLDPDVLMDCVSNGPYRIEESLDDGLVLVPSEGYWEANAVTLDKIEVSFATPGRALNQFQQQEVDLVRVDNADLPRARSEGGLSNSLERGVATRIWCLVPQIDFPPFEDVAVRRALGRVIDRRRLELIVEGRVQEATKLIPTGLFPEYDGASPQIHLRFDVDTALDEIGQSAYSNPGLWPEFSLSIPAGDTYRERLARDLLEQLYENLGLEIGLSVLDPEEFAEGLRERRFPLAWIEWTYRYPDPSCAYADLFANLGQPDRPLVWSDPGYDELARLADELQDFDERADLYARCEELLQDRAVYIPLVHPVEHYLVQPWVGGVPTTARGRLIQPGPIFTRFATSLTMTGRP